MVIISFHISCCVTVEGFSIQISKIIITFVNRLPMENAYQASTSALASSIFLLDSCSERFKFSSAPSVAYLASTLANFSLTKASYLIALGVLFLDLVDKLKTRDLPLNQNKLVAGIAFFVIQSLVRVSNSTFDLLILFIGHWSAPIVVIKLINLEKLTSLSAHSCLITSAWLRESLRDILQSTLEYCSSKLEIRSLTLLSASVLV